MGAMCGKEMPVVETANPPGAPSATSSTTEVGQIDLDVSGSQGMETEGFRAWSEMENGTERDFLVEEAGDDAAMKYLERQYSDQHHAMERNYNNPAFWYKQMQDAPMDADGFQLTAPFTLKKASDLARYLRRPDARPIPQRCVYEVLIAACKQAEGQKGSLQRLTPPASADERLYVCGDTHGQLQDVLWIFELHGEPKPGNHYLFNGDMADRGRNGIEIFMLLLAFKLACPEAVFMNRGNHEQRDLNERPFAQGGGFAWECRAKYPHDENLIELFQRYAAQLWRNSCAIRRNSLTAHPSPQVLLPDARRRDDRLVGLRHPRRAPAGEGRRPRRLRHDQPDPPAAAQARVT